MSSTGTAGLEGLVRLRPQETVPRPEATWDDAEVVAHEVIGGRYHCLVLRSPGMAARANAGQFVMITVPSGPADRLLLPRPMAIHRRRKATGDLEVIFNIVGRGTDVLASVTAGERLLLTGPLGRGFELPRGDGPALLIGRGIGVCAVMGVAEDARDQGVPVIAALSGRTRDTVIGESDCAELRAEPVVVTDEDGTSSMDRLESILRARLGGATPRVIMVCGSGRLTRLAVALGREWDAPVQVSLEAHMACGLGYCHGCAAPIATREDAEGPLVCIDGPVFDAGEFDALA
jgi:dihydroorotate dehydrogenase electron transfer subunit